NTKIELAFDADSEKVGQEIGGVPVYHIDEFKKRLEENDISVVILTVPVHVAQSIADQMDGTGIRGILNFTPARLTVPEHIRVHHIDLAVELQALVYFMKHYPV
ncbi:MAG: redox-sensing transcriptional repressor Rex, partial [Anaerobacillus sp.]